MSRPRSDASLEPIGFWCSTMNLYQNVDECFFLDFLFCNGYKCQPVLGYHTGVRKKFCLTVGTGRGTRMLIERSDTRNLESGARCDQYRQPVTVGPGPSSEAHVPDAASGRSTGSAGMSDSARDRSLSHLLQRAPPTFCLGSASFTSPRGRC